MSNIALRVENISKQYRIGAPHRQHNTLRDQWAATVKTVFWPKQQKTDDNRTIWALKDISFDVTQGEAVGIIGRNGAGKSTLLKVLSRITKPTSGRATINGRAGSLLEVGTGFNSELTGRENIYLNGAILGMTRTEIKSRFDEIVAFAELEKFVDTPVKRYSSGMYMRLAFAVAAHLEPEILIVDEVLAVGDAAFQRKCLNKMGDVTQKGRTVLFVSHNMPAITRLCPRTILLEKGQILQDGLSSEVASVYLCPDSKAGAERHWLDLNTAPGNDLVRLISVRIINRYGMVTNTFNIDEPIRIVVEYYNYPNARYIYANIQLFDADDNCVLASGDFVNFAWRYQIRDFEGKVTSTCTIPGNLLAEGYIRVLVGLTTHEPVEAYTIERDAVAFTIIDRTNGNGARGMYVGVFPGIVRPLLDWDVSLTDLAVQ